MKALNRFLAFALIGFAGTASAEDKVVVLANCQDTQGIADHGRYMSIVKVHGGFQIHSYRQTIAGLSKPTLIDVQQKVDVLSNQNTFVSFSANQIELSYELVKGSKSNISKAQLTLDFPEGKVVEEMSCKFIGRKR